jgi:uncharacterized protein (DUF305 family)
MSILPDSDGVLTLRSINIVRCRWHYNHSDQWIVSVGSKNRPLIRARLALLGTIALLLAGAGLIVAVATSAGPPRPAAPLIGPGTTRSSQVPVIVPGRPGESAAVVPPERVKAPDGSVYGPLDAAFVRMMIPHHVQAVEMAGLAPGRTGNAGILAIAGRIRAAQVPEIARLRAWLQARGLQEDAGDGHDHGGMPGMQRPEAMRALAAAQDDAFDRMFVAMMSEHHRGAVEMATQALTVVLDGQVEEMATAIAAEQTVEIARMRDVMGR